MKLTKKWLGIYVLLAVVLNAGMFFFRRYMTGEEKKLDRMMEEFGDDHQSFMETIRTSLAKAVAEDEYYDDQEITEQEELARILAGGYHGPSGMEGYQ